MNEHFIGVKYLIFDNKPVKTVWEEGIVLEVYVKEPDGSLKRHDGLAFYIQTEASTDNEISKDTFDKLSPVDYFGVQKK